MRRFRYVIQLGLTIIFVIVLIIVNNRYKDFRSETILKKIDIEISNKDTYNFVVQEDIMSEVSKLNIKKEETLIDAIPLYELEKNIRENPYVNRVEVYSDILGKLIIKVEQFTPKLRFIDSDGLSYFIDNEGSAVKQRNSSVVDVPIVSQEGKTIDIDNLMAREKEEQDSDNYNKMKQQISIISDFANYIKEDSLCSALFSQISISKVGDVELIPRIGSHYVIFSSIDSLVHYRKGISKMIKFYESQSDKGIWLDYSVVNMKYSGQVVCKK